LRLIPLVCFGYLFPPVPPLSTKYHRPYSDVDRRSSPQTFLLCFLLRFLDFLYYYLARPYTAHLSHSAVAALNLFHPELSLFILFFSEVPTRGVTLFPPAVLFSPYVDFIRSWRRPPACFCFLPFWSAPLADHSLSPFKTFGRTFRSFLLISKGAPC